MYVSLPFEEEVLAELRTMKCQSAYVHAPYSVFQLRFQISHQVNSEVKFLHSSSSCCVYHFECLCRASNVGRTTRRLPDRICEHRPVSLAQGLLTSNSSSIALHNTESAHVTNGTQAIKTVYRVSGNQSQPIMFCTLSFLKLPQFDY